MRCPSCIYEPAKEHATFVYMYARVRMPSKYKLTFHKILETVHHTLVHIIYCISLIRYRPRIVATTFIYLSFIIATFSN